MPFAADIYYHLSDSGGGEALPVVLIHGAGGNHLYWPAEIRRLPGFRVYALDLPGHGKSHGRGHQTIKAYAESILDWLAAIGLFQVVFIGHSMGGAIALTLARMAPEHVLGIGLVASGARLRVHPVILESSAHRQSLPTAIDAIIAAAFSSHANPQLVNLAKKRMSAVRPSVLHGDFLACNQFDMLEDLPAIKTPTLVVCGQEDQLTPPRYSQYLADQMPNTVLTIVPRAGHMVMLEEPQVVANALQDFLSGLSFQPGHIQPSQKP